MKTLRVTLAGVFALLLAGCPPPQSRQPPQPQTQKSPLPQRAPPQQPQQSRQSQASAAEKEAEQAERRAEAAERAAEEAEATAQAAQAAAQDASSRRAAEAARNQARIARQASDAARRDADAARQAAQRKSSGKESSRDGAAVARASAEARDRGKEAAERAQDANKASTAASRDGSPGSKDAADAAAQDAAEARARAQAARDRAEEARQQAERQRQTASRGQARGSGNQSGRSAGSPGKRPGEPERAAEARRAAEAAERQASAAEDRAEAADRRAREAEERGDIAAARRARIARDQAGQEAAQRRSEAEAWRQAEAEAARRGSSGSTGRPPQRPGRVPGGQPGDAWRVSRGDIDPRKRLPLPPLPESLGGEGRSFQDCEECPAMMTVRGGSFIMGSPPSEWGRDPSEGPQHRVTIGYDFAVGIYEITKAEFALFVDQTGHRSSGACLVVDGSARLVRDRRRNWRDPGFPQSPRDPVVCVSWRDAQAYTRWLSQRTGARYRLLSESEWEYAARGGSSASQFWGDNPDGACDYANGADLSAQSWIRTHLSASRNNSVARYYLLPLHECEDGYTATAPVGTYYPNAFGLHDMIANADEWVLDCWNGDYRGAPATGAPWMRGNCSKRVARSGSWINGTRYNRAAHRDRSEPDFRHFTIGFRVAREL